MEPFGKAFRALTGYEPFGWQARLFGAFAAGRTPSVCDIPTGLGKTAVMPIWLIALAQQAAAGNVRLPRRLAYVVDRRTVVDQATDIAERMRARLADDGDEALADVRQGLRTISVDTAEPLAISTLRGEHADNREWQEDPARAAIIIGTVDMIGSRLLFSGYGVSRRMRPFHAGLLGQDTLLVHDEAHLSLAFGRLVTEVARIQREAGEPRPMRVMELSATQRGSSAPGTVFSLEEEERKTEAVVGQRMRAPKALRFEAPVRSEGLAASIAEHAARHEREAARVIVYVRQPKTATEVARVLRKGHGVDEARIAVLTGTIRGHERDEMTLGPLAEIGDERARRRAEVFRGFKAEPGRSSPEKTEYLVATSAGEVGVDLDADHMVSDLTTLDSMIQRLGRVNRLGEGAAEIVVVPEEKPAKEAADTEQPVAATRAALEGLPPLGDGRFDASPAALGDLITQRLTPEEREACFSATPRMLALTDILLDGWTMTSIEKLPGSPPPEHWLHGVESRPPSVYVAWRREVGEIAGVPAGLREPALKTLFDKHPILARERVRGNRDDVADELKKIERRLGEERAILVPPGGAPEVVNLGELLKKDRLDRLREATIVLPPEAGGLDRQGMLDGSAKDAVEDVADLSPVVRGTKKGTTRGGPSERRRVLVEWDEDREEWSARRLGTGEALELGETVKRAVRLNRVVSGVLRASSAFAEKGRAILRTDDETGRPTRLLLLLAERTSIEVPQENPAAAAGRQSLRVHLDAVRNEAASIAKRLGRLTTDPAEAARIAEALSTAGAWHDRGKDRDPWQADIGNPRRRETPDWEPLAKSGRRGFVSRLSGDYRHEFGSMREASADPAIAAHAECDLILHLIAAHHGWARPHFRDEHGDIANDAAFGESEALAAEAMRRFARLQRRFGRWGLAWLESLLRAADYEVSSRIAADENDLGEEAG